MASPSIEWSRSALADLHAYLRPILEDDQQTAQAVAARIHNATLRLGRFPDLGRPGRRHGTRELVLPRLSCIVVYRANRSGISIVRLLHTSMEQDISGGYDSRL